MGKQRKTAGLGAVVVVLLVVFGLVFIVGVILLMMWLQPGIEHSPSQASSLNRFSTELRISSMSSRLTRSGDTV